MNSTTVGEVHMESIGTKTKIKNKLLEARENANDHVALNFRYESDWLRGWRKFPQPITECSEATQ